MSTRTDILPKASAIIADVLSIDVTSVTPDSTFEQLGVDSLDMMQIIMRLEEAFDIDKIDDDRIEHIKTVQDAVKQVESLLRVA